MLKNSLRLLGFLLVINLIGLLVQLPASDQAPPPTIIPGGTGSGVTAAPPTTGLGPSGCGCGSGATRTSSGSSPDLLPGEQRWNELNRQTSQINDQIRDLEREKAEAQKLRRDAEAVRNKLEESGEVGVFSLKRSMRLEAANEQIQEQNQRINEIDRKISQLEKKKRDLREEYDAFSRSAGQKAGRDYKRQ